jgi:hypothetical protein
MAMSTEQETTSTSSTSKLLRLWGMLFRFLFIATIWLLAYFWLYQPDIGDIPIGQLTLRQISSRVLAAIISVGCVVWFFSFPRELEGLDYKDWGRLGLWIVGILMGAIVLLIVFAT